MHRSFPFPFFFLVIRGMRLADLNSCSGGMIKWGVVNRSKMQLSAEKRNKLEKLFKK